MLIRLFSATLLICAASACTYNVQPVVPSLPPPSSNTGLIDCKAVLLIPEEFLSREYVSSFEGREVRIRVGPPAAQAVEAIARSRYSKVEAVMAAGDGTLTFIRLATVPAGTSQLVMRPRFVRLESSVVPFRYNIEVGLAVDIAGIATPVTPSGAGVGTAGLYTQSEIQKAADEALAGAIFSLATSFPQSCK